MGTQRPTSEPTFAGDTGAPEPPPARIQAELAYRRRAWLAIALLPFAIAALAGRAPLAPRSGGAIALEALGWVAFLAYAALRLWSTLYIGGRKDHELQTEGPYSLCRNPLYLGSFALAISIAAFLESVPFACAVAAVSAAYVRFVVAREERLLTLRFGDAYRAYLRRTPRFLPRLRRPSGSASIAVDADRLHAEAVRLARAAMIVLTIHALASARPL